MPLSEIVACVFAETRDPLLDMALLLNWSLANGEREPALAEEDSPLETEKLIPVSLESPLFEEESCSEENSHFDFVLAKLSAELELI